MDRTDHFITVALSPDPGPLIGLGALAVMLALLAVRVLLRRPGPGSPRAWRSKPSFRLVPSAPSPADPHAQMEAVQRSDFEKVRLLNREEARLLPVLESVVRDAAQGHRVMAQTSLGEVIRPVAQGANPDFSRQAFAAINSKRLDFAIFDREGYLVCAIEYQGTGHYHATTFLRDAVKREALRKASVHMVEVRPDFDPNRLKAEIRPFLQSTRRAAEA